jgi:hypothetical protein
MICLMIRGVLRFLPEANNQQKCRFFDLHKQMKHPPLWFHGTSLRLHVPCNVDNARAPGTGTGGEAAKPGATKCHQAGYFNLFYPYTACREHLPRFSTKITQM